MKKILFIIFLLGSNLTLAMEAFRCEKKLNQYYDLLSYGAQNSDTGTFTYMSYDESGLTRNVRISGNMKCQAEANKIKCSSYEIVYNGRFIKNNEKALFQAEFTNQKLEVKYPYHSYSPELIKKRDFDCKFF